VVDVLVLDVLVLELVDDVDVELVDVLEVEVEDVLELVELVEVEVNAVYLQAPFIYT
jgi:hypothetical protein